MIKKKNFFNFFQNFFQDPARLLDAGLCVLAGVLGLALGIYCGALLTTLKSIDQTLQDIYTYEIEADICWQETQDYYHYTCLTEQAEDGTYHRVKRERGDSLQSFVEAL